VTAGAGGAAPRIIGMGYSVPSKLRKNDDPIFDHLNKNPDLFKGYDVRRVLSDGETLIDIMLPAAKMALADAGIGPADVDLLIGDGSMSEYLTPNVVSQLHHALGLPEGTWPLALTSSFSQFNAAVMLADALVRAGRARNVLIAFGANWTRYVDYTTPQSISAGDGAAACVVGPSEAANDWEYVDSYTIADTSYYGSMYMLGKPAPEVDDAAQQYFHPYFWITEQGVDGFKEIGGKRAPTAVTTLLEKHDVEPSKVCLITHQASDVLMKQWAKVIRPGFYVNTIADYANLVEASVPFNLAWATRNETAFTQGWLVTLCLGPDMHANAMLLRRNR
jgi:3-oxoacyl-[acyl-carrier-protein] synthase-3